MVPFYSLITLLKCELYEWFFFISESRFLTRLVTRVEMTIVYLPLSLSTHRKYVCKDSYMEVNRVSPFKTHILYTLYQPVPATYCHSFRHKLLFTLGRIVVFHHLFAFISSRYHVSEIYQRDYFYTVFCAYFLSVYKL